MNVNKSNRCITLNAERMVQRETSKPPQQWKFHGKFHINNSNATSANQMPSPLFVIRKLRPFNSFAKPNYTLFTQNCACEWSDILWCLVSCSSYNFHWIYFLRFPCRCRVAACCLSIVNTHWMAHSITVHGCRIDGLPFANTKDIDDHIVNHFTYTCINKFHRNRIAAHSIDVYDIISEGDEHER